VLVMLSQQRLDMDIGNYEFETSETHVHGETETRIRIPLDKLKIGQVIYQVDFYYEDGIQPLEVRGIELTKQVLDPQTGEEFSRPIKAGETHDAYFIELGDGWDTHPYEKYLTKEDAYEAALKEHDDFIKNNQAMIDRWQISVDNAYRRMENIKNKLKEL